METSPLSPAAAVPLSDTCGHSPGKPCGSQHVCGTCGAVFSSRALPEEERLLLHRPAACDRPPKAPSTPSYVPMGLFVAGLLLFPPLMWAGALWACAARNAVDRSWGVANIVGSVVLPCVLALVALLAVDVLG
eukprot:m51a1_g6164 hypothetical protein (133) ;mRNA; r:337635-338091